MLPTLKVTGVGDDDGAGLLEEIKGGGHDDRRFEGDANAGVDLRTVRCRLKQPAHAPSAFPH